MDGWQPTDAELYDAFVGRRRSKAEIAALSLERVTHMVTYWRRHKVSPQMRDLPLSDEQIAEAVVRYAQSVAPEEAGWSPAEDGRKQETSERILMKVGGGALIVSLVSAAFASVCGFLANVPPGMPQLEQFVYHGVFFSVTAITVVYLTIAWHLIKNRRRITAGRLIEVLVVVVVPVALFWLALALTGTPHSATELRLQRNIGKRDLASAKVSGWRLARVDLAGCDPSGADLSEAALTDAHLDSANLQGANLSGADLRGANLWSANLRAADLSHANLTGAIVTGEQLAQAASLEGATLPDGSRHE